MNEAALNFSNLKYNKLETDFKLEAVAANIVRYYGHDSKVMIRRIGINDRAYLKDIKEISVQHNDLDDETVVLETYRESIYDYLPEAVFHPPSLGFNGRNIDNVVKEIRKQKQVEQSARNFFQPFELEIFYAEVNALLKESEIFDANHYSPLLNIISELWPILKKLDRSSAETFVHILPFLYSIKGDKGWIERFLTYFLGTDVQISFVPNSVDTHQDESVSFQLGSGKLGVTTILSGDHQDGNLNWEIAIGAIDYGEIEKYVDGHPFRKLLQEIYDIFMPVNVLVSEKFVVENREESFTIGKKTADNTNILGYSTYL